METLTALGGFAADVANVISDPGRRRVEIHGAMHGKRVGSAISSDVIWQFCVVSGSDSVPFFCGFCLRGIIFKARNNGSLSCGQGVAGAIGRHHWTLLCVRWNGVILPDC